MKVSLRVEKADAIRIHAMNPEIVFTEGADGWDAVATAEQVLAAADLMDARNDDELPAVTALAADMRDAVRMTVDVMSVDECRAFWLAEVGHDEIDGDVHAIVFDYLCEKTAA